MKPTSIFGRCGVFAACLSFLTIIPTQAQDNPAPAAAEGNKGEAHTHFVWFRQTPEGGGEGGASPMSVRVLPNSSGRASVGVLQEFFGGTGNMWNTAAWIAAFNASTLNNTSIVEHEYIIKVGGHVDGPSAGMLTTAAMLAALRGDAVREDTTMTGTINPDGTAGVVGGIAQKIEGAKEKGLKRFGYPVGTRSSQDMNTGQVVDMNAKAQSLGMEAKEIRDIYEAYEFLTGKKLDRPEEANDSDLDLSPQLRTKVQGWTLSTRGELERRYAPILQAAQNDETIAASFGAILQNIEADYAEAQNFENSSMATAAYYRYLTADAQARAVEAALNSVAAIAAGDMEVLGGHLQAVAGKATNKLEAYQLQARASIANKSLGGRVDALNNMSTFAQAFAYYRMAGMEQQQFAGIAENFEQISQQAGQEAAVGQLFMKFIMATLYYEVAGVLVEFAEDWVSLASSQGPEVDVTAEHCEALARAYASAGGSCLSYFDALITEPQAEAAGVTKAAMQQQMGMVEFMYPFAVQLATYSEWAEGVYQAADPMESALFKLGAGSSAYIYGAAIVNKYYSLSGQLNEDGTVVLGNKRVLGVMLDRARKRALEEAGATQEKFGFIPESVKMNYQLAIALREGDDDDKLEALQLFWQCAYLCDIARALAGEA